MANNPFEESKGPKYGNAYEDSASGNNNNDWNSGRMPSPSDYIQRPSQTVRVESNKIEVQSSSPQPQHLNNAYELQPTSNKEEVYPQPIATPSQNTWDTNTLSSHTNNNAYQYTGTPYGNKDNTTQNSYSPAIPPRPLSNDNNNNNNDKNQQQPKKKWYQSQTKDENGVPIEWDDKRMHPSKLRLLLRFIQFIAAVGHLGFAAGASPFSGEGVPFDSSACFYYLYAVAILTLILTIYHMGYYFFRRCAKGLKMNRVYMIGLDLLFAILWGIGVIVEVAKFNCPPGQNNHWCDFYNVSIFFGFVAFASFIVAVVWDSIGGCITHKR